jgi:hypothetical protein
MMAPASLTVKGAVIGTKNTGGVHVILETRRLSIQFTEDDVDNVPS